MKAIILAAGEGNRMRPLTEHIPKPMLTVHGKTLISYILESLPDAITEYIVVVGYKREVIQENLGSSYKGKPIRYVVQEQKTGTADALKLCHSFLEESERFLLTYADDIYDKESITRCLNHQYSLLVAETDEPERYGVVTLNSDGSVLEIEEKPESPKTNLIAPGIYILDTSIFKYEPKAVKGEYYFTTMLDQFIKEHKVFIEKASFWVTIGYPYDLEKAKDLLRSSS
jgi:UDP-N-acetylglucosamine diphosphorylase / glucose-1-phosphate thymidylyltransferase / UDP-N-acetylgalactosamine diphosphorylase / glucosamine-1-phosphate N-acetyltransferase / galactosamine-1-phosphate N-acetyltransferase